MLSDNLTHINFLSGLAVGLFTGLILGYIIALRSKKPENNITAVQILAIITLFGYLVLSFMFDREVSWVIAVAILATGYGARGGAIIEGLLERYERKR